MSDTEKSSNSMVALEKARKPYLFQPGQSGNPLGRPKSRQCLTSAMRAMMDEVTETSEGKKFTYAELVARATVKLALQGNSTALKEVWDRMDGKIAVELDLGESEIHLHFGADDNKL